MCKDHRLNIPKPPRDWWSAEHGKGGYKGSDEEDCAEFAGLEGEFLLEEEGYP